MDENLHNIEKLFHEQLENNEMLPSKNAWKEIDKQLDKDNLISIKKKYNYLKKIAALLLLLLFCFTVFEVTKMYKNSRVLKDGYTTKVARIIDAENGRKKNDKKNISTDTNLKTNTDFDKTENAVNSNTTSLNKIILQNNRSETPSTYQTFKKDKFTSQTNFTANIIPANASYDDETLTQIITENKILFLRNKKNIAEKLLLPTILLNLGLNVKTLSNKNIDIAINKYKLIRDKNDKKQRSRRFSLTPFLSSDIAWYRLQDDKQGVNIEDATEIDKEENNEISVSYGVMADYKINKHWGLQSGFIIANSNITTDPKHIFAQPDNSGNIKYRINTSSGYGYILPSFSTNPATGDSIYAFTSTHKLQYVGIPVAVTYNVPKGKLNFKAVTGVSANILTKATLETTVEKGFNNELETVNKIQGLKKVYFSGLAGVGVDYKLSNKISVTVAPTLRFALNSINKDAAVKSYPVSLGFNVGLKIGL